MGSLLDLTLRSKETAGWALTIRSATARTLLQQRESPQCQCLTLHFGPEQGRVKEGLWGEKAPFSDCTMDLIRFNGLDSIHLIRREEKEVWCDESWRYVWMSSQAERGVRAACVGQVMMKKFLEQPGLRIAH